MLSGPSGLDLTKLRVNGFKDYLAKYPGMKVVAEKFSSTASSEALTVIQDFLQAHPDLKVVYAFNGPIAIGGAGAASGRREARGGYGFDNGHGGRDPTPYQRRMDSGDCPEPACDAGGTCCPARR